MDEQTVSSASASPDRWRHLPLSRLPGEPAPGVVQETVALSPTASHMICLAGPCRHYQEILMDADTTSDRVDVMVARCCSRYHDEDGGEMNLQESSVFACSGYAPRWPTIATLVTRFVSVSRLAATRRYYGSPVDLVSSVILRVARLVHPEDKIRDGEKYER